MKNLLNDMSFEERQKIREQHTGGMKVTSNRFTKLVNGKLGHINPLLNEQADNDDFSQTPIYTITEKSLINSQIPSSVIQASAPQTMVVNGRGSFKIQGTNDLYGYDFSSILSTINGEYYFVSESSEYLNKNYAGKYNAKEGTQYCGFVDEDAYGRIIYIGADGKSIVGRFAGGN